MKQTPALEPKKLQLLEDPDLLAKTLFRKLFAQGYRRAEMKVPGFEDGVSNGRVSIGIKKVKHGIHVYVGIPISEPETTDLEAYDYHGLKNLYSRNPIKISNTKEMEERMMQIIEIAQGADVHFKEHYDEKSRGVELKAMGDIEIALKSVLGFTMTPGDRIRERMGRIRDRILVMFGAGMAAGMIGSVAYFDIHRTADFIHDHPEMVAFKDELKEGFGEIVDDYERLIEKAEKEGNLKDKILVEMLSRIYGLALGFPIGMTAGSLGAGACLLYRRKNGPKYVDQL